MTASIVAYGPRSPAQAADALDFTEAGSTQRTAVG